MSEKIFDVTRYAGCARKVIAEGAVLLKNDNNALPLTAHEKIAVFGRSQFNYYKSGTGSGGLVNVNYVVSIPEALEKSEKYVINPGVMNAYKTWLKDHPYDSGSGWGNEPWFQAEMPIEDSLIEMAAAESETALIIIGRSSGEDQDNKLEKGSYLLTDLEEDMLRKVCGAFRKSVVLLNVGNIMDMKWVAQYNPSAVLYLWQGGQEGGNGALDILDGTISPCGKLADTIAANLSDYPSTENFGGREQNIYTEDIYVGYRYFETFSPEKVLYPFGFGLSYTSFCIETQKILCDERIIRIEATVTNTGSSRGKEVVQAYVEKPQGNLGQPVRVLCGYVKTGELAPGESENVVITFRWDYIASYDDAGYTGYKSCYVLEAGNYVFCVGDNVRSAKPVKTVFVAETTIVQKLEEVLAPVNAFSQLYPVAAENGRFDISHRYVSLRTVNPNERRNERLPQEYAHCGDQGWKLADVRDRKVSMENFVAQMTDEDLCALMRGEGMSSPKVTPGTGGAFGGVTDQLLQLGIPVACCTDGPSGIRMDCGTKAFAMPNGTCMACTFNDALIEELFQWEGLELRKNRIDMLLGPGMNIHRNPLNGRNFEYFSEDPLLSGKIAAAQLKGMHKYNVTGVIKHFACNNQEYSRNMVNAVVSERALREIYLKGFEIAVKEGDARCIMSAYNPINGIYTSSNYDLLTTILRKEWGYTGLVMTDWWAKGNDEGKAGDSKNTAAMARAQNDLFMVVTDAASNSGRDNSVEGIKNSLVTRGEFQRNAANICRVILTLPVFNRFQGVEDELDKQLAECLSDEDEIFSNVKVIDIKDGTYQLSPAMIDVGRGKTNLFQVYTKPRGVYKLSITCRVVTDNALAQVPLSVFQDRDLIGTITLTGENNEMRDYELVLRPAFLGNYYLKLYFGQSGIEIDKVLFQITQDTEEEMTAILAQMQS